MYFGFIFKFGFENQIKMRKPRLFRRSAVVTSFLIYTITFCQLFHQDFASSPNLRDYVAYGSPSNGQFTSIGSTGAGMEVSIFDYQLRFKRSGNNSGSYSRIRDFYPVPGSLIYRFEITVSGNSSEQTTAAVWQVGHQFTNGNTAESNAAVHSRIGLNIGGEAGTFSLRTLGAGGKNSANFSGRQTVTWYINNSGGPLTYTAPDMSQHSITDDQADVWVGTSKVFGGIAATSSSVDLKNIKFIFNAGTANIDIDQVSLDPFPTSSPSLSSAGIGFLTGFQYSEGSGPSAAQFISVSGSKLQSSSGNVVISPPAAFEISTDGSVFSSANLLVPYSSGLLPPTKVFIRLKSGLIAGDYVDQKVLISGGAAQELQVLCSGTVKKPVITLGAPTGPLMNYPLGSGPSPVNSVLLSGSNLTGEVTLTTDQLGYWELSRDKMVWSSIIYLIPLEGLLMDGNNQIYIRLKKGLGVGLYSGNLTVSAVNAPGVSMPLTGKVLRPLLLINNSTQNIDLTGFAYDAAQGPSTVKSITVEGIDLSGDVTVEVSENWEISTNATYTGSNIAPYKKVVWTKNSTNMVTARNLYVRLKNGLEAAGYTGSIIISSPNSDTRISTLSGEVAPAKIDMRVMGGSATISHESVKPSSLNRTLFAAQKLGESQTKTYSITNQGGAKLRIESVLITGPNAKDFTVQNAPEPGTYLSQAEAIEFSIEFAPTTVGYKTAVVKIANNDSTKNPYTFTIGGNANFCGASSEIVIAQQGFEEIPKQADLPYLTINEEKYGVKTGFIAGKSTSADKPSGNNFYAEGERAFRIQGLQAGSSMEPFILEFGEVDTGVYSAVDLSLRVAAFSLGSTANGMDSYDSTGTPTVNDLEKIDFVLIEVSPDGGLHWYQQAKIVSDRPDLTWSFGSAGTATGTRKYEPSNNLTYFKSDEFKKYSSIVIKELPSVAQLKVRISTQSNNELESWILDDIKLMSTGIVPKVWNGSAWSPTPPIISDKVIINGNYRTSESGNLEICQCEINGATLTVGSNDFVTIGDRLVNNGHIIVENEGNFLQINEVNSNSGSGTFTVNRNSNIKRLDYIYWSSPVSGQNLKEFSLGTLNNRFYTYNEGTDLFDSIDPVSNIFGNGQSGFTSAAKGYAIRADNKYGAAPQIFRGQFSGVPNNSSVIFPLQYGSTPGGTGFNLVGNPYPSNINFYKLADDNRDQISKTAYFWTNLNPTPAMQGSNYPGEGYFNNYAILNGTGGIPATFGETDSKGAVPTNIIKVGQGFIVKAKRSGDLVFNNAHRSSNNTSVFFNKSSESSSETITDRFWLHLTTPIKVVSTTLIGYLPESTNAIDEDYDAPLHGLGADALFTQVDDRLLGIQGRSFPFSDRDKVQIGTNHYAAGEYVISLGQKEGLFSAGQPVYLKDHLTQTSVNLQEYDYRFTTEKGITVGRFEIIYQKEKTLAVENTDAEGTIIYREGNQFFVRSVRGKIAALEVFDSSGRLIERLDCNNYSCVITAEKMPEGIYFVRLSRPGKLTVRRIIR